MRILQSMLTALVSAPTRIGVLSWLQDKGIDDTPEGLARPSGVSSMPLSWSQDSTPMRVGALTSAVSMDCRMRIRFLPFGRVAFEGVPDRDIMP